MSFSSPTFIDAPITIDSNALLTNALANINTALAQQSFADWTPQTPTLEVILLNTIAQMASSVAGVSAVVVPAIFRAMGEQIWGVPYLSGSPASIQSTWTVVASAADRTIPQGTPVLIDSQVFNVLADTDVPISATTVTVNLVASENGTAYNGLGGSGVATLYNQLDWVSGITLNGGNQGTAGGLDAETDDDYQQRLAQALSYQTPRPVSASDYSGMATSIVANLGTANLTGQTGISGTRAATVDNFYPAPRNQNLSIPNTGTSQPLTYVAASGATTLYVPSTASANQIGIQVPRVGSTVTGTSIPSSTTVIAVTPFSVTISAATTAAITSGTQTFSLVDTWGPKPLTATYTCTSGATTITVPQSSLPFPGAVPMPGAAILGAGIPNGTFVADWSVSSTNIIINLGSAFSAGGSSISTAATTATESSQTVCYIGSWQNVPGVATTWMTDASGNPLSYPATAVTNDSLIVMQEWLQSISNFNVDIYVEQAPYREIQAQVTFVAQPGYTASAVASSIQTALTSYLNQSTFGAAGFSMWTLPLGPYGGTGSGGFIDMIRHNVMLGMANVNGVAYIKSLTLGVVGGVSTVSGDLNFLDGPALLPTSQTADITVTSATS